MAVDYTMIVTICVTLAFWLGILIDGYLIRPFDHAAAEKKHSLLLFAEVVGQLVLQGLIALVVTFAVRAIPSPMDGVLGYRFKSPQGTAVRTPAIVLFAIILLTVSSSLQARITYLIARFDKNTCPVRAQACLHP